MPRPQFTLRALLVAMLVVGAFLGGVWLRRERAEDARQSDHHTDFPAQAQPSQPAYPSTGIAADAPDTLVIHEEKKSSDIQHRKDRAIAVARAYLKRQDDRDFDATFTAREMQSGYSVFVEFIGGYDDQGNPLYYPGGHCLVEISRDWKVIEVIPGE